MRATHHSSQAVLLHQPEGVLVAGSEVIGLGGAHVTPGHRAHGVDDICHAGKTTQSSVSARLTFKQRLHKNTGKNKSLHLGETTPRGRRLAARDERIYSGNETAAWIENQLQDSFLQSAQIFMSPLVLSFLCRAISPPVNHWPPRPSRPGSGMRCLN